MVLADFTPSFRKFDFVTDASGYISMLIYNSHPPGSLFIAPKYYPDPNGTWSSHETQQKYSRFEYYWNLNLKQQSRGKAGRVYEVDKNPLHDYATDVVSKFNQHLVDDPCHGVPMYRLPRDAVVRYWDARMKYQSVVERRPANLDKFASLLKKMGDAFEPSQVGITGSYLYEIYQDFSDINFVVYDEAASILHDMLMAESGLLKRQDIEITMPSTTWPGWLGDKVDVLELLPAKTRRKGDKAVVPVKNRFIGSIHDPFDKRIRAGFWLGNTTDPHPHGTFKKTKLGIAVITARLSNGEDDLPSGHFHVDDVDLLGFHPTLDITSKELASITDANRNTNLTEKMHISAVQVIGEFNRMFLSNESIIAFGLVEEITLAGQEKPVHELLVGGREVGGWIFPRDDIIA
ncbi:MAG: hypothetical protein Q6373_024645 [Candidatus Sigynarchaeota archaeon]